MIVLLLVARFAEPLFIASKLKVIMVLFLDGIKMSYDSLVRLAEEFRLEKEVGLALRCLSAASQIQNLDNLQKADVNLNIGRLLLKYGKNKGPDE